MSVVALPPEAEDFAARHGLLAGFWVFAYGSLMWNPEFAHDETVPAVVHGYHRRFCVYSHVYRGSPRAPGLLLGLDRGGSCRGLGFHVPAAEARGAWAGLWEREMVTFVYRPVMLRAATERGVLPMVAFVAERGSQQYCAGLDERRMAEIIRTAVGTRGPNRAYFDNTLAHLREAGIRDHGLDRLAALVHDDVDNVKISPYKTK
jgi:cation transport protein ChaC